jgi:bacterioferritin (cytochrome b1)
VLPSITSAVSQVFHHSLLFQGEGKADLAQRELDMALALMYRSEAMLERLLDLGGLPTGSGHGAIRIGGSERDADRVCLAALDDMVSSLEHARAPIEGLADPTTHTLLDGIARALRDDRAVVAARLAA